MSEDPAEPGFAAREPFQARLGALQARVNTAALALHERNVRPTVARVRAALGGGSPNDLGPALRRWRDEVLPTLAARSDPESGSGVPPLIADLISELWSRATAAAVVELKGGSAARQVIARTEEAHALRDQLTSLRDQLQRESLAYGELRAQAARYEAIARDALGRVREAEIRERELIHKLGTAQQRLAEFAATIQQFRGRQGGRSSTASIPHPKQRPAPKRPRPGSTSSARPKSSQRKPVARRAARPAPVRQKSRRR